MDKLEKENVSFKTIKLGILAIVLYFVISVGFALLSEFYPKYENIISVSSYIILAILFVFLFFNRLERDFKHLKNNLKKYLSMIIKKQIVAYVIYWILCIIVTIFLKSPNSSVNQQAVEQLPLLILTFVSILLAPIVEELLFRGSIRRIIKKDTLYIVISGCVFGFLHSLAEATLLEVFLIGLPYVFMGSYFAYMYVKTENICVPMICHFLHNLIVVLLLIITKTI